MAKKKKTRQQKIIADLRRQIYASQPESNLLVEKIEKKVEKQDQSSGFSIKESYLTENKKTFSTSGLVNTSYLINDLRKTALLTLSIIAVQLVLLFILRSHIFVLNGLIY